MKAIRLETALLRFPEMRPGAATQSATAVRHFVDIFNN